MKEMLGGSMHSWMEYTVYDNQVWPHKNVFSTTTKIYKLRVSGVLPTHNSSENTQQHRRRRRRETKRDTRDIIYTQFDLWSCRLAKYKRCNFVLHNEMEISHNLFEA